MALAGSGRGRENWRTGHQQGGAPAGAGPLAGCSVEDKSSVCPPASCLSSTSLTQLLPVPLDHNGGPLPIPCSPILSITAPNSLLILKTAPLWKLPDILIPCPSQPSSPTLMYTFWVATHLQFPVSNWRDYFFTSFFQRCFKIREQATISRFSLSFPCISNNCRIKF